MRYAHNLLSGFCAQHVFARGAGVEAGALGDGRVAAEPLIEQGAIGGEELVGIQVALAQARDEAPFRVEAGPRVGFRLV